MQNQEIFEEIFNPKPIELLIGDNDSNIHACGKNQNSELTFKGYKYLINPSGLFLNKKHKIIDVSSGNEHTALLTEYGYVFVFGSTLHNKLGLEGTTVTNISTPKLLPLSEHEQITQIVCGPFHTLALTSKDQVWGWGGTLHKKTGTRDSRPNLIQSLTKFQIIKIGCGDFHSVALSDTGILFSWGGGGSQYNKGQTGHGHLDDILQPRPIQFFQNSPVHDFECGGFHTVSIQQDGLVFSWGEGLNGQLGQGTFQNCSQPQQVLFQEELVIESVSCGGKHTFFRTKDGLLYSCGHGAHGQTGQKNQDDLFLPTLVKSLQNKFVEKIKCGWSHSIALVNPNYVYTCGANHYGQLGLGDLEKRFVFTFVEKLAQKNVDKIRAGGHHSWFIIDYDNPLIENFQMPSPDYQSPNTSIVNKSQEIKKFPKSLSKFSEKNHLRNKSKDSQNLLFPGSNKKPSITISKSDQNNYFDKDRNKNQLQQKDQFIKSSNIQIKEPDESDEDLLIDEDNDIDRDIVDIQDQKNVFQNSLSQLESKEENIHLNQSAKFSNFSQAKKNSNNKFNNKNQGNNTDSPSNDKIKKPKSKNFLKKSNLKSEELESQNEKFFNPKNINQNIDKTSKNIRNNIKPPLQQFKIPLNQLQPIDSIKFNRNSTFGSNPTSVKNNVEQKIIRVPVDQNIPQYYFNTKKEVIKQKQKIWQLSLYYLLFVDLDFNHKFILLNFKENQENNLIEIIEKTIELIQKHDPSLLKYYFVKYQDYCIKTEDNILKKVMSCCYTNEGIKLTDQTYVLMLVQESNLFKQLQRNIIWKVV